MAGAIALVGGNEFRPGCEEMDSAILKAAGEAPVKVLILPTAAVTGPQRAASDGVRHFSRLGGNASELMVLERIDAEDEGNVKAVSGASVIYFTGGSPDHLLGTLKGSELLRGLRGELGRGAILAGSSAGAMVMGSVMRSPASGEWTEGLGIVAGVAVLPHHENSDPSTVAAELSGAVPADITVLGIDAMTCCFGGPGGWRVLGPGKVTVYRNGSWSTHISGETLPDGF